MTPIWLSVGRAFMGLSEIPGPQSNPLILRWAKDIGAPAWYNNDSQAWCAVWANRIFMACQMAMSGKGYDLLRARSFETWGQPMREPSLGAVLVFNRPEGAHVGFYLGERDDAYFVLGGNQGNAVSETYIQKHRLSAIRWPAGVALPTTGPVVLIADGGPVSRNEA